MSSIYKYISGVTDSSPKSEASFVLTAKLTPIALHSSMQDRDLGEECAEISNFDFDLKTNNCDFIN